MQRIYLITTLIIMAFIFVQSALPGDLSSNESNVIVQFLVALFDVDAGSAGLAGAVRSGICASTQRECFAV